MPLADEIEKIGKPVLAAVGNGFFIQAHEVFNGAVFHAEEVEYALVGVAIGDSSILCQLGVALTRKGASFD